MKGKAYCSSHYITYDDLYDIVLHDIQRKAKAVAGMDEYMIAADKGITSLNAAILNELIHCIEVGAIQMIDENLKAQEPAI